MPVFRLLLLGLCLILFTSSATTDLALPGPQDDEARHGALAVDMLHPPFPYSEDYTLRLGRHPFPFGITPHSGALQSYLLWPLFALFEPSIEIRRGLSIFIGLLLLVFSYRFLSEHAGPGPAFLTVLLLSLDTAFVFFAKLDAAANLEILLWMVICLWSFGRFGRSGKLRYLMTGLIASVLGIYGHITFSWFIVACCVGILFCFPKELRALSKKRVLSLALPTFFLLLVIFFYWYIGDRRRILLDQPAGLTGVWIMFERLSTVGGMVPEVLFGRFTDKNILPPGIQTRPFTDLFLIGAVLLLLCRGGLRKRFLRFCFIVTVVLLVEIAVSPMRYNVLRHHRILPLYLFLFFFSGIAVWECLLSLTRFKSEPPLLRLVSFSLLFLMLVATGGQMALKREADSAIRRTGGKGFWSDGIYAVAETLEREEWEKTICLDWGHANLILLGKGKIPLETSTWDVYTVSDHEKLKMLSQMVREASPGVLFLLYPFRRHKGGVTVQELEEAAANVHKRLRLEHFFYDREGEPIYAAYTVQDKRRGRRARLLR